jgi:hypothetical protein
MEIAILRFSSNYIERIQPPLTTIAATSAKPADDNPELSREEPEAPPESTESGQLPITPVKLDDLQLLETFCG